MSKVTWKWHGPLVAGCAFLFAVAAAQPTYRLAGTIELEEGESIAIVDVGDGRQQLVHVGDQLEIGEVVSIVDREVIVQTTRGLMVLSLEGIATLPPPEAGPSPVITDMVVNSEQLQRLKAIDGKDERQVTAAVLKELGLPKNLQVRAVWVGAEQHAQMRLALPDLKNALQAGDMAHLFFEEGGPVDELYLVSAEPAQENQ